MKTWRYLLSVGVLGVSLSALAQVNLRPDVARALQSAQEAIQAKHPEAALDSLQTLRAQGELSEPERLLLERLTVVAAMNAQQFDLAGSTLDRLLQNQTLTAADRLTLIESRINVALRLKNQEQVALWAKRYIELGGSNPKVYPVLLQALAAQQKFKEVLAERDNHLKATPSAQADEAELRVYALSYRKLNDTSGLIATLGELVRRYPSTDYWSDLLNTLGRSPQLNTRQQLDISRLMEQTDTLADAEDYLDMAGFALKSGLPDESLRLVARAQSAQLFDTASRQKAASQLRQQAQQRANEDDKELRRLTGTDASTTQQLADVAFSKGDWKQAATLYAQALGKGVTRREAETRLHLGIALLRDQQTDAARQAFGAVKGDDFTRHLAELWLLLAH